MEGLRKILKLLGIIFLAIGGVMFLVVLAVYFISGGSYGGVIGCSVVGFLGFIFACIGGGMVLGSGASARRRKRLIENGERYTGKIFGYVEDTAILVNGSYPMNIVVHYFDRCGTEREIIIPTKFAKGSGAFPIGATIDFVINGSRSTWIDDSVRYDHIPREEELMDNKPIDQTKLTMVAVSCPSCGANYTAAQGYMAACPYCGHGVNL